MAVYKRLKLQSTGEWRRGCVGRGQSLSAESAGIRAERQAEAQAVPGAWGVSGSQTPGATELGHRCYLRPSGVLTRTVFS